MKIFRIIYSCFVSFLVYKIYISYTLDIIWRNAYNANIWCFLFLFFRWVSPLLTDFSLFIRMTGEYENKFFFFPNCVSIFFRPTFIFWFHTVGPKTKTQKQPFTFCNSFRTWNVTLLSRIGNLQFNLTIYKITIILKMV